MLFGKRLTNRIDADDNIKACMLPDWKKLRIFHESENPDSSRLTDLASPAQFHTEMNYKTTNTVEVDRFFEYD